MKKTCHHGPTNTFILMSPVGDLELVSCPRGIHSLSHQAVATDESFKPDVNVFVDIKSQLYEDNGYTYKPALNCVEWLRLYFSKDPCISTVARPKICVLPCKEGSFTQTVLKTLPDKVPFGHALSYGELARMCGSAHASRAVGQAMRNNNVSIIVPCHRVILGSGQTGNYSGGRKNSMKVWLLKHEGLLT